METRNISKICLLKKKGRRKGLKCNNKKAREMIKCKKPKRE